MGDWCLRLCRNADAGGRGYGPDPPGVLFLIVVFAPSDGACLRSGPMQLAGFEGLTFAALVPALVYACWNERRVAAIRLLVTSGSKGYSRRCVVMARLRPE